MQPTIAIVVIVVGALILAFGLVTAQGWAMFVGFVLLVGGWIYGLVEPGMRRQSR